jgi:transposase
MDYEWLYERLDPYYNHNNGRPGTDPVVLIKMVLIQHLFGIPSLRQTHREIQVNLAYRWFLGYGLLDDIPHFVCFGMRNFNNFRKRILFCNT